MANASKHHVGSGSQGKGAGVGGMTNIQDDLIEPNMVLSNRDKSQHSDERGLDSKSVQVEQFQDNPANHDDDLRDGSTENAPSLEEQVRAHAYKLWEDEGRPEGRHHEHWERAAQQVGVMGAKTEE